MLCGGVTSASKFMKTGHVFQKLKVETNRHTVKVVISSACLFSLQKECSVKDCGEHSSCVSRSRVEELTGVLQTNWRL